MMLILSYMRLDRDIIMYSSEIQSWLSTRNYHLTSKEYIWLILESASIQIDHIKYDPFANKFLLWTNDGYSWEITVNKSN